MLCSSECSLPKTGSFKPRMSAATTAGTALRRRWTYSGGRFCSQASGSTSTATTSSSGSGNANTFDLTVQFEALRASEYAPIRQRVEKLMRVVEPAFERTLTDDDRVDGAA